MYVLMISRSPYIALEKLKNNSNLESNDLVSKDQSKQKYFEYNIGLEELSVLQIIKEVEKIIGSCPYEVIGRRFGDPSILIADSSKIKKELGWEPKFNNIDEIILHSYNWIRKSHELYS